MVAVAIGGWLAWDTWSKEGPTIQVSFDTAEGLQAGQSQLKYKDIVFGTVKSLVLSDDRTRVVVTVETTRQAAPLLTDGTIFWVVKPRLFAGSISGLETLVSGSYIGMLPPQKAGEFKSKFTGQEDPPILPVYVPGRTFQVKSHRIGSISLGSPIFYRDLAVGEVLGWEIADMVENVTIHAFIRAPYDRYVDDQTRFWNASGISLKLGPAGLDVQVESLKALILGGIAFETPATEKHAAPVAEDRVFPLFANREEANSASYTRVMSAVSYFSESVSGLAAGSEVRMRGLKIGEVTDVRLSADPAKGTIVAVVHYQIQPERIVGVGKRIYKTDAEAASALLDKGLRATLDSASLITGQQTVALEFVADAPRAAVTMESGDFVVPTTEGGGFSGLASSANAVLNKVNAMPFAQIGAHLAAMLTSAQDLVQKFNAGASPAAKQLPEITATLEKALTNVNKLAVSVEGGYGDNTKFHRDLDRLLMQTDESVRSLRSLTDLLTRHPEALIKGRAEGHTE